MDAYFVPANTPCKVARTGQSVQDYTTTTDQAFTEDELIAYRDKLPDNNPAAAYWAKRGYYVFKRQDSDWYLIVKQFNVDIAY